VIVLAERGEAAKLVAAQAHPHIRRSKPLALGEHRSAEPHLDALTFEDEGG
jgi:hypothetical protein